MYSAHHYYSENYIYFVHRSFGESPLYMQVIYDFMARNSQELSVMKGDVVQVRVHNPQSVVFWQREYTMRMENHQ